MAVNAFNYVKKKKNSYKTDGQNFWVQDMNSHVNGLIRNHAGTFEVRLLFNLNSKQVLLA